MDLIFQQLNPRACKTYLVGGHKSREAILIDPALECLPDYIQWLDQNGLKLTHVIDTHSHADHLSGGAALKDRFGCEYVMHSAAPARCVTSRVSDGHLFQAGGMSIRVLHTPGHTQDSITLVFSDRILSGDTLFLDEGGAGRDDLPGGDPGEHWESLQRIAGLPDHLTVYPAHDYRNRAPSSLADQKRRNPFMKHRSREDYIQFLQGLMLGPAHWMKEVLKANAACSKDPKSVSIPAEGSACEMVGVPCDDSAVFIEPSELRQRLDAGDPLLLLDVRQPEELVSELGHLPGIRHIPIGSLADRIAELQTKRDCEIVAICKSGVRARMAAQILQRSGYSKVLVLTGGMLAWIRAGHPSLRVLG